MIINFNDLIEDREKFNQISDAIKSAGGRIIVLVHPDLEYATQRYTKRLIKINKFPLFVLHEIDKTGNKMDLLLHELDDEKKTIIIVTTEESDPTPHINIKELLGDRYSSYVEQTVKLEHFKKEESACARFLIEKIIEMGVSKIMLGGNQGKVVGSQKIDRRYGCVSGFLAFIEGYSNINVFFMEKVIGE